VTSVTNASGVVQERYGFDGFGKPRFMDASFGSRASASFEWETLFDGCRFDTETGLYLMYEVGGLHSCALTQAPGGRYGVQSSNHASAHQEPRGFGSWDGGPKRWKRGNDSNQNPSGRRRQAVSRGRAADSPAVLATS
jgi:hypothetical protein